MTGAYYYLWYNRPNFPILGGGIWDTGYADSPILGEYSSREENIISQHIDWAKEAGLDFFIINWANKNSWDDTALKSHYLKNPKSKKIKFCLHYDSSLNLNRITTERCYEYDFKEAYSPLKTRGEKFLEDFEYMAENYFNHPQYFKIDGKPVVYIYNVSSFKNNSEYFDELINRMKKKGTELFLIADVVCWSGVKFTKRNLSFLWNTSPKQALKTIGRALSRVFLKNYENNFSLSEYFKGISGYNMYGENRTDEFLNNIDALYKKFSRYAKENNLIFIPNVMPGYDDRKLKSFKRPVLEREEGNFYEKFIRIAQKYISSSVPLVFVTSFNEWHEGTEIEPSKEHGVRYLELTKSIKNEH